MNKIICRQVEIIHIEDIEKMYDDQVYLKTGKKFEYLPLQETATYLSQTETTSAGKTIKETVNIKVKYDESLSVLRFPLEYYVLRLYTDSRTFYVGSTEYPAVKTVDTDKITVNLSFKAESPA